MEILHEDKKRTVLVALDGQPEGEAFCDFLSEMYDVVRVYSTDDCLKEMRARIGNLSVVIVDIDMAEADDFAFLRTAANEPIFNTIAILLAAKRQVAEKDMQCLEEGVVDFLTRPHITELTYRRIDNAIRVKRSTTFYEIESMLRELPSNILLKDAEGRYVFCTHYWHHLDTGDDPNWTIRGKTDLEIRKDKENALKAMEADKEIIRTGKGTTYVIEINTDGVQEFMELIKRPVFDDEGNVAGIIALINDVTEAELSKRELERRARTDELTGMLNRLGYHEFVQSLGEHDDFPIAVISADCDELKTINDTFGHLVGDEYIRMAATLFKAYLPEKAKVFRTGGDEFVAFAPNMSKEEADELASTMQAQAGLFKIRDRKLSVSFGTSVIASSDDNSYEAIANADQSMYENKRKRKHTRQS